MSEAAIRKLYMPPENYRVSAFHYPAGTIFSGSMRSGQVYVIEGSCEYRFLEISEPISLLAGETLQLPEGEYEMEVTSTDPVFLVLVWEIPPEFRVRAH
jgi:hypothetical protein